MLLNSAAHLLWSALVHLLSVVVLLVSAVSVTVARSDDAVYTIETHRTQ